MAEARGKRRRPYKNDPLLELLFQRGLEHERRYVASLEASGSQVIDLSACSNDDAVDGTLELMRSGTEVIAQGALRVGRWLGRPDVLRKVPTPSTLGAWYYEVADTKLARETKAGTILQLGLYSELLAGTQGMRPEYFHVITPDSVAPISYRVDDFGAYVRLVRSQMEQTVVRDDEAVAAENYPEPVAHCEVCPWIAECNAKRQRDDHLSLVAGITRLQRRELNAHDVSTLTALAKLSVPLPFKPKRGAIDTFIRVHDQAEVQLESRDETTPVYRLRDFGEGTGLCRLPEPSPGDLFLDLEGDPFAVEGGREYLFGTANVGEVSVPTYRRFWAVSDEQERQAFESVIDLIMSAWEAYPTMHVYHYAPYEPSAFKRLMGRYATREAAMDRLLREQRFVDLYAVVRQGLFVGVEQYSIKNLEPLYGFNRQIALSDANRSLRLMEHALELNTPGDIPDEVRATVEGYNKDDCVSTLRLRDWLEGLRTDAIAGGATVPRPSATDAGTPDRIDERKERVESLRATLLADVPTTPADRSPEQKARWILAYLLDWHRREDKATWWEYYRLRELTSEELLDEPEVMAGLEFVERASVVMRARGGKPTGSVVDRYRFPIQEMEIAPRDELKLTDGTTFGIVKDVDRIARTIDIQKGRTHADTHPTAVFAHTYVRTDVLENAIYAIASRVADDHGLEIGPQYQDRAARALLLANAPRLRSAVFRSERPEVAFATRIVSELDDTVLAIQGPPGAGKTYCAARMILELVKQGKKVGVTATSHKVIRNLLNAVARASSEIAPSARLAHKCDDEDLATDTAVTIVASNDKALRFLVDGKADVVGGTPWLWARDEFVGAVDVLFVDEAGQMALANAVAVARAAKSVVLLGDPQQLEQPHRGTHPDGVSVSALQHILGHELTITPDRGIFLPITWRLAPSICSFTSEVFYEGRLQAKPGLEHQILSRARQFDGNGLWVVEVDHDDNRNFAPEEIEVVMDLVRQLTAGAQWTSESGESRRLTGQDILALSPYNAQVSRLAEQLASTGIRVGTVDKFQGQEAPVAIYSMATSRAEDAPRGMEFLYSLNRLNVAASRARCASILVANRQLFEAECRTPRQINTANGLCRFRELARVIERAAEEA